MTYLSATPVDYTFIHAQLRLAAEKKLAETHIMLHGIHTLTGYFITLSV